MYSVLSWLFLTLALLVWTLPAGVAPVAREEEPKVVVDTKAENADSVVIQGRQCSFFGDSRLSQAESSLINCSWYKSDSCCKRTEVTSVFSGMMSLKDASRHCRNLMHYMMCYFCSPFQGDWYRTRVIVCKRFCEAVYDHCRSATYQGQSLESQYSSGVDFCEQGQNFQVVDQDFSCFDFDPNVFSGAGRGGVQQGWFLAVMLFLLYVGITS